METIIKWNNIKDKMPVDSSPILIYTKYCRYKIEVGHYDYKINEFITTDGGKVGNMEYWAEIPDYYLDN